MRVSRALAVVIGSVLVVAQAMAADIGVAGKKLIIVDKSTLASRAKVVYVSKDKGAGITKGTGTDTAGIDAQFDFFYGTGSVSGTFVVPAGALAGSDGWKVNKSSVAKYINKAAPAGPTGTKVAVIKPGKLLKIVGKNLGDTPIDIVTAGGPGAGTVETIFTVNNGAETNRHCTSFPVCSFKVIAAGTGAKLVCKNGTAGTCPAGGSTTTSSTSTTTVTFGTSSTSTSSSTTTSTSSSTSSTAPATCVDGIQNQDETDIDCGGTICPTCTPGDSCLVGTDSDSSVSTGLICQAATCTDGVQNGSETDIDCGGSCPADCSLGQGCNISADCISTCSGGVCRCATQAFTFNISSNTGGSFDPAEWPSGTVQSTQTSECSVRANRPGGNIDGLLDAGLFNVNGFSGFSNCFGSGGEAGTGCTVLSCPPAGIPDCDTGTVGRPNCSAALNGSGSARLVVQCSQ
jgi:hypothetical protein